MKKNKNRKYSLTAKERKALNSVTKNTTMPSPAKSEREEQEQSMLAVQKNTRKQTVIATIALCLVILLIVAALLSSVIAYAVNPYRNYDFVVARFRLSNGMELEYVIEEDEYDIAATNFIFLAKNKYFDNTVFFDAGSADDNTDGWVRFGGYEEQPTAWESSSGDYNTTKHHSQNTEFCQNFKALPNSKFSKVTDKFGYDLYADANGENADRLDDIGVLAFMYDDTSTEFQMSYKDQPSTQIAVKSGSSTIMRDVDATMVGYALNDETIENLQKIAATASRNTSISIGAIWYPPSPTIYIKSVKVYNLDSSKWKNFDFIEYMSSSNDNGPRLRGWTGRA